MRRTRKYIFYVNVTRVCKTEFHSSSQMEWVRINQSASATSSDKWNHVFLVSLATRTQFLIAITWFWSFWTFLLPLSWQGRHFCVSSILPDVQGALRTMTLSCYLHNVTSVSSTQRGLKAYVINRKYTHPLCQKCLATHKRPFPICVSLYF